MPQFPPSQPVLVAQIYSRLVAANVKMTLETVYPDEHPVRLVHAAGTDQELVEDLKLYEIDRSRAIGLLTALYLPPLAPGCFLRKLPRDYRPAARSRMVARGIANRLT